MTIIAEGVGSSETAAKLREAINSLIEVDRQMDATSEELSTAVSHLRGSKRRVFDMGLKDTRPIEDVRAWLRRELIKLTAFLPDLEKKLDEASKEVQEALLCLRQLADWGVPELPHPDYPVLAEDDMQYDSANALQADYPTDCFVDRHGQRWEARVQLIWNRLP